MAVSTPSKPKRPSRKAKFVLPVSRSASFTRVVIDKTIVLQLGRDLDVSCLQFGPEVTSVHDHGDEEEVKLAGKYDEVVRLRMHWPEATNLAMQILKAGIEENHLDPEKIVASFTEMVENKNVES